MFHKPEVLQPRTDILTLAENTPQSRKRTLEMALPKRKMTRISKVNLRIEVIPPIKIIIPFCALVLLYSFCWWGAFDDDSRRLVSLYVFQPR